MNRNAILGLTAALTITGVAGWVLMGSFKDRREPIVVKQVPKRIPTAEELDVDAWQALATESCLCARSGSARDCWAEYNERVAAFEVESMASACAPISTSVDCIRTTSGEECVVTGFDITVGARGSLCTQEEAVAVEQAFDAAPEGGEDRAIEMVLARIRRGEKVQAEPGQEGCA